MKYRFVPDLNRQDDLFSETSLNIYGLTPNKIYEVIGIKIKKTRHKTAKNFLILINDRKEELPFNSDWFLEINLEREEKLNKLFE